jgi:hypothetical protein
MRGTTLHCSSGSACPRHVECRAQYAFQTQQCGGAAGARVQRNLRALRATLILCWSLPPYGTVCVCSVVADRFELLLLLLLPGPLPGAGSAGHWRAADRELLHPVHHLHSENCS